MVKRMTRKVLDYLSWPEREKILEERKKRAGKQINLGGFVEGK